ncbi:FRG domain-containing protein [Vibrio sp. F13]|uniref:FRG domain-containing protein n=3 Tax=unclassified Vibrio TaxID=2614977 RepID=UPI0010BD1FEE|nr:FRG domain-containing protein [Vibrio sp. F13]TKF42432.1 FRG domain-containing protein [Vibrio sp. F13]
MLQNINDNIEEISCVDSDEIFEALRPDKLSDAGMIFRGHEDATWKLVPSVFRSSNEGLCKFQCDEEIVAADQIGYELMHIRSFLSVCDERGLSVFGDSIELRNTVDRLMDNNFYLSLPSEWPIKEFLPILATMQHHGFPTRLLDWSTNSLVALSFAAHSAIETIAKAGSPELPNILTRKLAVWMLDRDVGSLVDQIAIVTIPGSVSQNLASQRGLFTLVQQKGFTPYQAFKSINIDDLLLRVPNSHLKKVTVPICNAVDIANKCRAFGIDTSSLFPSIDGVAKEVLSRQYQKIASNKINRHLHIVSGLFDK